MISENKRTCVDKKDLRIVDNKGLRIVDNWNKSIRTYKMTSVDKIKGISTEQTDMSTTQDNCRQHKMIVDNITWMSNESH